jgi:acyl-CoA synthetase (AMP-forming)/AMP-acid ligase II
MALAFLGVSSAAVCAPLNPAYRSEEFEFFLSDLGAKALVLPQEMDSPARAIAAKRGIRVLELVRAAVSSPDADVQSAHADDIALILHTSGTTSRPKIVPLTHRNLTTSAENIRQSLGLTGADRCLNVMPLFHIHGLIAGVLAPIAAGGSIICTPGFDVSRFPGWLVTHRPTWYTAVPAMHQAVLARARGKQTPISGNVLRFIRSSSSPLPARVLLELEELFQVPVIESYGMTEASHQMASNPLPPGRRKPGSVGQPAGPEIAVMDANGTVVPEGSVGEIVIRGPNVMLGYENNPEANAQAYHGDWFRTGDQGYLDPDGYLFLTGRLKEIINRGGEKISPREVDEVLMDHPGVAQAITFALPNPQLGEDIAAAVVVRPGHTVSELELQEFSGTRLADFKVPRRIVLVDEIPKGPTGKPQRIGLAAMAKSS